MGLGRERKKMARELEREIEGGGGGGGEMVQIELFQTYRRKKKN